MKLVQILPTVLIVIDICSAVVYGFDHNGRQVAYWLSAAVITAAVTF